MTQKPDRLVEKHDVVRMTSQGMVIPALVVIVGQACSLKCKHCANFSPYAPSSAKRYPLEKICADLNLIFQSVHRVKKIQVQGGEPFLYKKLPELLDFIGGSGKVDILTVATNGTILPNEDVFQALKRNQVRIRISNYSNTLEETTAKLVDRLAQLEIDTWMYEFALDDSMWYDMGGITAKPAENSDSLTQHRFLDCPFHDCFTLENGKISRCSRAIIAEMLQEFTAREGDFLPVIPSEDFPEKLWSYLDTADFMEACRFCYGATGRKVAPAQQLEN